MDKKKILVVDDESDIRNIVSIYLENNGFEPIQAESGEKALELLESRNIDLAILDVMMPDMDGITLCIKIREKKATKRKNAVYIRFSLIAKIYHFNICFAIICLFSSRILQGNYLSEN